MNTPLMPKATALWLIENTSLTFEQIAHFCGLHILEIKAIADGEAPVSSFGFDPVMNGQVTQADIERCTKDPKAHLSLIPGDHAVSKKSGVKYTPVACRQDRPDAIAWLLKYYPELTTGQIMKLVRTTKATIQSVQSRTHWNTANIKPRNPVTLGICSQKDLETELGKVKKAEA